MASPQSPVYRVHLFGELRVTVAGKTVSRFPSRKTGGVLAYLALGLPQAQPRDIVADLIWPDSALVSARRVSLSAALYSLRRLLEVEGMPQDVALFVADRHSVGLNPATVITDLREMETLLQQAASEPDPAVRAAIQESALADYHGADQLLRGFYDDWAVREQERIAVRCTEALASLALSWEAAGDGEAAIRAAYRAVESDSFSEDAQYTLIRLLGAQGRTAAALSAYAKMEARLADELGAVAPEAIRRLAESLRRGAPIAPPPAPAVLPAPRPKYEPAPTSSEAIVPVEPEALSQDDEPTGGAVPLSSRFYVVRPVDAAFYAALDRRDSVVLLKGARQVGKTSLLARGFDRARRGAGHRVALMDFDTLGASEMEEPERLFRTLIVSLTDQLGITEDMDRFWDSRRSPGMNLEWFLRRAVLEDEAGGGQLVWGLDQADRLFSCRFGSDVFALLRSWHNRRALDPTGPWARLTLAIAYATEAHLFIQDLDQSPFNVGTRLVMSDFDGAHIADLNVRYGSPLRTAAEQQRFEGLIGGQPYLVRRGLAEMASRGIDVDALIAEAERDEGGPFAGHLRRLLLALTPNEALTQVVRGMLRGAPCPNAEALYRLRSAGLLVGETAAEAHFRCALYETHLRRQLT